MNKTQTRNRNTRLNRRLKSHRLALVEAIEPRLLMSIDTWTGGAGTNLWNAPGNWQANTVPAAGDSVVFPAYGGGGQTPIDLGNNVTVGDITLDGNYQLVNDAITVNGGITTGGSEPDIQSNLVLNHNATITAGSGDAIVLYAINDGGNQYGFTEQGSGTVILHQPDTYTGATVVAAGTLQIQANIDSSITLDANGTLDATSSFTAPSITTASGATIVLESAADVTISQPITTGTGSTLNDRISNTSNGQIIAAGSSVYINGLSLSITTVNYTPPQGHVFTLISNQTGTPVSGTFSGLGQGDITEFNGIYYQINYYGGQSGHDVTLTVVPQPAVWTDGNNDGNWNEPGNWQGNAVPTAGQNVEFPNLGSTDGTINVGGNLQVGSMTFDGTGYTISGNHSITLDGNVAANTGNIVVASNLVLGENTTVYTGVGSSASGLIDVTGSVSDGGSGYGLTEVGTGGVFLQGAVTYTGVTTVNQGTLSTQHNMAGGVVVNSGGEFSAASVNVPGITSSGGISLSWQQNPEDITFTGNVTLSGGTLSTPIEINGSGGLTTGEMTATGSSVSLGNATLQIIPISNATPALATVITLISNQAGNAVSGTFNGLPQGAVAGFSGSYYQISYTGGSSHHDVTLTVVAAPVAHVLSIAQQPSSATAGQALGTMVVDVLDQYGEILTSDNSTVQITAYDSTTSQVVAFSGTTSVNASSGVATFSNLLQDTAGSYILAISSSDGVPAATTNTVTVSPAAATQLAFVQQPANTVAGQTMAPIEVAVEDQFGNIVTNNNSGVVVQNFPNVLNGTISAGVSNGIATFSDLYVTQAGAYTINASDSSLAASNSSSFTVTPAAATQLVFVQQPANTVAGQTMPPIEVAVEDQYDNIATNNNSGVVVQNFPNVLNGTISASVINGIATFNNIDVTQVGTYTINASDASLAAANSSSFTVTPAAATQLVFVQQPANTVAGQTMPPIEVAVEDQYDNIATNNNSGVVVQNFPNVLNGTISASVINGIATFNNIDVTQVGTYTINASDASLAAANSSSFTVTPAAAAQLAFVQQPANTIAGQTMTPIEVAVEDQYGNIVTSNVSGVVVQNFPNVLNGTISAGVSNGIATFSDLDVTQAGAYTINASDASLTAANSSSFTITPAAAAQLAFVQQPTATTAGQTMAPIEVAVEDQYGNIVTNNVSGVVLQNLSNVFNGTISAAVSNGIATFSDLDVTKAGTYTINASDASLAAANSNSFTITPAAATQLAFVQQPASTTAGQSIGNVEVEVEDSYGNVVTSDQSDVTITATSTGVAMPASVLTGTTTVAAQKGVALFNHLAISLGGSYSIHAADAALVATDTNPITVSNIASHIVPAGQKLPPTLINSSTAFGQSIVHAKSLSLKIENQSTGAVLMVKNVGISHGKATIGNLKMLKAGDDVMVVSDGQGHTMTQTYTIQPAAASRLVFASTPAFSSGSATVAVRVTDAYGNQTNSADGQTMTLKLASHSSRHPQLSGTLTATVVNGMAVFADVEIDPGDRARLTARVNRLRPAVSDVFTSS